MEMASLPPTAHRVKYSRMYKPSATRRHISAIAYGHRRVPRRLRYLSAPLSPSSASRPSAYGKGIAPGVDGGMCRRHSGTALLDGEQYEASIGVMLLLLAGRCVGPRVGVALLQEGVLLAEAGVGGMGLGIGTYDDLTSRVTPSSTCERGETGGQTDRDRHTQQPIILSGKRRAHLGDSGEPQRIAS